MYQGKKFIAVIPARGGSKGIPHKNIALVQGRPLIDYTIQTAKQSQYLDAVYVSTDDSEIADTAAACGAQIIMRPPELASDTSKTIDAMIHALNQVKDERFDYVVLLQATQPLRLPEHIDGAIEKMCKEHLSSLLSISPARNHPILLRSMEESGKLKPLLHTSSTVRRQDFQQFYVVNGSIYINKVSEISQNTSFNDNEYGYFMDTEYDLDIDEPYDLFLMEQIIRERNKQNEIVKQNKG